MTQQDNRAGASFNEDPFVKALMQVSGPGADPRLVLMVAHGLIELMINTLVDHYCRHANRINDDNRTYPHSVKLVILHEKGILYDQLFDILDRFRKLRNEAAHQPFFSVDTNRLRSIADPMENALRNAQMTSYPSDTLDGFCRFIMQSLFTQFQGVLMAKFTPTLYKHMVQENTDNG